MRHSQLPTATVALVHPLLLHAARRGVPPAAFVKHFGLDPAVLADADGRLPLPVLGRIWEEIGTLCDDPDTPLHAAQLVTAADLPLLALLFLASPTLGVALQRFLRFERAHHGQAVMELRVKESTIELGLASTPKAFPPSPAVALFGLASVRALFARATGRDVPVLGVSVRYPEPKDRARYDAHFGVRVEFGAADDCLRAPREVLDYPHPGASQRLSHVLEAHARSIESTLSGPPSSPPDEVREAVERLLPDGDATVERVARALGLAPRTLQRRLEREGRSLRELVDTVRRSLALRYVEQPTMPLATIALLVGFSDQTAFHRAFVRWTGRTPGDHRRELRGRPARWPPGPDTLRAP